jgi:ElaB/YqjD/DUF883 family membrane-anchored ribosome-binding protein
MSDPDNSIPGRATATSILPKEAQDRVMSDAADLASTAQEAVAGVKDEAVTQLGNLKDQAQTQLSDATEKAKSFAGEQKDAAGEQLSGVADAISKVASELQDQPQIAGYANELASGIKRVSDTVKNRNVDELLAMAEDFGRTQPVAFLGVAALAGFVASRFVLSSANRRKATSSDSGQQGSTPSSSNTVGQSTAGTTWSPSRQGGM